jgi:hypothetical protein
MTNRPFSTAREQEIALDKNLLCADNTLCKTNESFADYFFSDEIDFVF